MSSGRWNDEMLDAMRQRGDDPADTVITDLGARGESVGDGRVGVVDEDGHAKQCHARLYRHSDTLRVWT